MLKDQGTVFVVQVLVIFMDAPDSRGRPRSPCSRPNLATGAQMSSMYGPRRDDTPYQVPGRNHSLRGRPL